MNQWSAWGPTVVTVLTVIFGAGRIYGRIGDQEITIKRHDDLIVEHTGRLDGHDIELAKSAAWREGYNFAKKDHAGR